MRRLLTTALVLAVLILIADLLIGLGLDSDGLDDGRVSPPPRSSRQVREELSSATETRAERSILLIGDSVLAGDVLANRDERWRRERVLDHLRRERSAQSRVSFFQIAANALLPTDLERIVGELRFLDPEARVELLVELNPRYWSPLYRESRACTQEFFCTLPGLSPDSGGTNASLQRWMDRLRAHTPVRRHRDDLERGDRALESFELEGSPRRDGKNDPILSLARVRSHYRLDVSKPSAQVEALDRVLRALAEDGRKALFFATPLRDDFMDPILPPQALSNQYGLMAKRIHDEGGAGARFVSLDHPLFQSQLFVDHVHLTPKGNRLLALNLLAEMGVGLVRAPAQSELAYDHGIDRTLITSADLGRVNGPPWSARFEHSPDVVYAAAHRRLIIVDTESHSLRQLRRGLRSVEPWIGSPGRAGRRDGPFERALFDRPRSPVAVGRRIYLIDGGEGGGGDGARIREIAGSRVRTLELILPARWTSLASDGRVLFALDPEQGVFRIEKGRANRVLAPPDDGTLIEHIAVSQDGRIFVADRRRILHGSLPAVGELEFSKLSELVGTGGLGNLPPQHERFPMPLDQVAFERIGALIWVERYGGLLVADEVDLSSPEWKSPASERAHLRFIDPARRQLLPWLKPYVNGNAYFPERHLARARASAFHVSSLALDPTTCDLYLLERERSRLTRIGDGLYGAARVSDTVASAISPFGRRMSREIIATYRPQRFRAMRARREGLRGSLIGLHAGSSMIVSADQHGYYSLVRALELELSRQLGLTERLQIDVIPLAQPNVGVRRAGEIATSFLLGHFVPDFVLIDANQLTKEMSAELASGEALGSLTQISQIASERDVEVIVIDTSTLGARGRDGVLPRAPVFQAFFAELRRAGLGTVDPTPMLVSAHLEVSPWGNIPHRENQHHGSPQAIDATAQHIAALLAPRLAQHFDEFGQRTRRAPKALDSRGRRDLQHALASRLSEPRETPLLIPNRAAHVMLRERTLDVLVDVGRVDELGLDLPGSSRGVASVIHTYVMNDVRGQIADELRVRFVRFKSYDEYGLGALDGAEVLFEVELDTETIGEYLSRRTDPE